MCAVIRFGYIQIPFWYTLLTLLFLGVVHVPLLVRVLLYPNPVLVYVVHSSVLGVVNVPLLVRVHVVHSSVLVLYTVPLLVRVPNPVLVPLLLWVLYILGIVMRCTHFRFRCYTPLFG